MVLLPGAARADAPTNDAFVDATPITSFPFAVTPDATGATTEVDESTSDCPTGSIWYRIDAATAQVLQVTLTGPAFETWLRIYQDTGGVLAGLSQLTGCMSTPSDSYTIWASAGDAYYLQVSSSEIQDPGGDRSYGRGS